MARTVYFGVLTRVITIMVDWVVLPSLHFVVGANDKSVEYHAEMTKFWGFTGVSSQGKG